MRKFLIRLLLLFTNLLTIACVHEYPENGGEDPTMIETNLLIKTKPQFAHSFISDSYGRDSHDFMYFVVEFHKNQFGDFPLIRREVGVQKNSDGSATIEFNEKLHAGYYKGVAYAVFADDADGTGTVFQLDDLNNIGYNNAYCGSTEAKECYEMRFDIDLSPTEWFSKKEISGLLNSPMGRIEIITTDVKDFIPNGILNNNSVVSFNKKDEARSDVEWQWEDYYVVWKYDLYYPVGYSAYTGLPNKAQTEVSFKSDIVSLSETEALLGFDYVFVNGQKSQVTLSLEVYDKNNRLINIFSGINIPIERGETTTVRGEYLTKRKEPGIGIDPGFDGDITVVLPN